MVADEMIIDILPVNITTDIISRLSADSIIQCKRVCKTWRTLIDELLHDPTFIQMHISSSSSSSVAADAAVSYGFLLRLKLSNDGCSSNTSTQFHIGEYYYHDNLRIKQISKTPPDHNLWNNWSLVSSCNGLICLVLNPCRFQKYEVCICNPVTREYVNLMPRLSPGSKRWWHQQIDKSVIATGFGYHPCTNEYKVVRIIHRPWKVQENHQEYVIVSVYTLGSGGGWRNKGEFPYQLGGFPDQVKLYKKTQVGLLFNGALHWKKLKLSAGDQIVSFDLANEEFRLIPLPLAPEHHECRENED